jgi:hypothetical protein
MSPKDGTKDHTQPPTKDGTKKEDLKKKTSAKKQVSHSIQRIHPLSRLQRPEEEMPNSNIILSSCFRVDSCISFTNLLQAWAKRPGPVVHMTPRP